MVNVKYLSVSGTEVTLDKLTEEWIEICRWMDKTPVALDYEVQQYIQRLIERDQLSIEVWD